MYGGLTQGPQSMDNSRGWAEFTSPDEGDRKDWVLILDDQAAGFQRPGRPVDEVKAQIQAQNPQAEKVFPGWD